MQLVAYGAQDVYLTGNPQITLFKVVYRRHTNFSMECIELPIDTLKPSGRTTVQVLRNGDLATKTYLRVTLPDITPTNTAYTGQVAWVRRLGHAMIKSAEIQIGGSPIDKHWGTWLDLWYELTHTDAQDRGYSQMIGDTQELTTLTTMSSASSTNPLKGGVELNIPLQFWFCRNYGLALPLIALQYHEVRINLELHDTANLVVFTNGTDTSSTAPTWSNGLAFGASGLLIDYIYLDSEERRRFAQVGHEYLIEQIQLNENSLQSGGSNQTFTLNFNHPCKELIWAHKTGAFNGSDSTTRFLAYTNVTNNGDYDNNDNVDSNWNAAITTAAQNLVQSCILASYANASLATAAIASGNNNGTTADAMLATGLAASNFTMYNCDGSISTGTPGSGATQVVQILLPASTPLTVQTINIGTTTATQNLVLNIVKTNIAAAGDVATSLFVIRNPLVDAASTNLLDYIANATIYVTFASSTAVSPLGTGLSAVTAAVNVPDQTFQLEELSVPLSKFTDNRLTVSAVTSNTGAANTWGRNVNDIHVVQCNNYGIRLDGKGNMVTEAKLILNGHDRFSPRKGGYFNYVQPWQHHTHTPADGVNVYSFGLHPEQHQPTGTCNMSRIDSARLYYTVADTLKYNRTATFDLYTGTNVYIFVTNYNVLRIMSGMGGLAYSN